MQVQTSNTPFSPIGAVPQQRKSAATQPANSTSSTASSSSIVTISRAARDLAQQNGAKAPSGQADPIENYRVPNWLPSLFGINVPAIDGEAIDREMRAYWDRAAQLTADGSLSEADRAQLAAVDQTSTKAWNAAIEAGKDFSARHQKEFEEFRNIYQDASSQSLREQGIVTHQDYVEKVLHAPGDNLELRNSIAEKILANPRAVELINTLHLKTAPLFQVEQAPVSQPTSDSSLKFRAESIQTAKDNPAYAKKWAEEFAYNDSYEKSGPLVDISHWPIVRYSGTGELVTDENLAAFKAEAAKVTAGRIALYQSEKAKGTSDAEILEKLYAYVDGQSDNYLSKLGWTRMPQPSTAASTSAG